MVDVFGDNVMNCHDLLRDTWLERHDTGKLAVVNEFFLSKVPVECEVYGLFADLIPAAETAHGEQLQWGPAVPDRVWCLTIASPSPPLTVLVTR